MTQHEPIYRVFFTQDGKTYELYARYISEETMIGFIEVDQLIFSADQTLVDPAEERLKSEFKGVERLYVPMHAILRIDEVISEGPARIKERPTHSPRQGTSNVWQFPTKKPSSETSYE